MFLYRVWGLQSVLWMRTSNKGNGRFSSAYRLCWGCDQKLGAFIDRQLTWITWYSMMGLWHGNTSDITGPLCRESSGYPVDYQHKGTVMQNFHGFFVVSLNQMFNRKSSCWWFDTLNMHMMLLQCTQLTLLTCHIFNWTSQIHNYGVLQSSGSIWYLLLVISQYW